MLHGYLRDTLVISYNKCKSCGNRTQFPCVDVAIATAAIGKKEKLEKVLLEPQVKSNPAILRNIHSMQY